MNNFDFWVGVILGASLFAVAARMFSWWINRKLKDVVWDDHPEATKATWGDDE